MPPIHVAITRRVRAGCEAEFEAVLLKFFQDTATYPGVLGAQLLRPGTGTHAQEYGFLRTFASAEDRDAFYQSEIFQNWQKWVRPLVVDDHYTTRELSGLEAFFRGTGAPPRWKMAMLTWLGVFPTVTFWSNVLGSLLSPMPRMVAGAIVSAAVVITLAWVVMPFITRIFHGWLHPDPSNGE